MSEGSDGRRLAAGSWERDTHRRWRKPAGRRTSRRPSSQQLHRELRGRFILMGEVREGGGRRGGGGELPFYPGKRFFRPRQHSLIPDLYRGRTAHRGRTEGGGWRVYSFFAKSNLIGVYIYCHSVSSSKINVFFYLLSNNPCPIINKLCLLLT